MNLVISCDKRNVFKIENDCSLAKCLAKDKKAVGLCPINQRSTCHITSRFDLIKNPHFSKSVSAKQRSVLETLLMYPYEWKFIKKSAKTLYRVFIRNSTNLG